MDGELWEILELATEDELEGIHGILYGQFHPDLLLSLSSPQTFRFQVRNLPDPSRSCCKNNNFECGRKQSAEPSDQVNRER